MVPAMHKVSLPQLQGVAPAHHLWNLHLPRSYRTWWRCGDPVKSVVAKRSPLAAPKASGPLTAWRMVMGRARLQ